MAGVTKGRHAAPDGVGNASKFTKSAGRSVKLRRRRADDASAHDGRVAAPTTPPPSTFDIESGTHVAAQLAPDASRFGRAWHDPKPTLPPRARRRAGTGRSGHVVPGEGRSRSRLRPFLVLLMLLVAVAGGGAFVSYGAELWGGKRVPALVGMPEGGARAALEERGLRVVITNQPVDDGVGIVLATDPAAGTRLERGAPVTVVVGAARIVPTVEGLTEHEARQALMAAGAIEVRTVYQQHDAPEGTAIGVTPAAGSTFTSRDVIVLSVAQAFTVPEVAGLNRRDAVAAVEGAGLVAHVVEVPAAGGTVGVATETDPAAGTKLEAGAEVVVKVTAGMPATFERLPEYFGAAAPAIASYVAGQGFRLSSSWLNDMDEAQTLYTSTDHGTLAFTSRPFSHVFDTSRGDGTNDMLSAGYAFSGIRWEIPASMLPDGASQLSDAALASLVATCGFSGQCDACDGSSVVVPAGMSKSGASFKCVYGEMNGLAWTVLIANDPSTRAVVTCSLRSLYDTYDLSSYDGRICCLVACADVYTEW